MKSHFNRRKFFALLVLTAVVGLLALCGSAFAEEYGGGNGTETDPYLIYTAEQMQEIGANPSDWNKHFKLMADIDLSGYTGTAYNIIGNSGTPFRGVFDGNDHTISNFTYTSSGVEDIGIFGYVYGADVVIKDLLLQDPNINVLDCNLVGCLVSWFEDGVLSNCRVIGGRVSGNSSYVGGLVGYHLYGTISDCWFVGSVLGKSAIGGLIGYNTGVISKCYSRGIVSGKDRVGGLIGQCWHPYFPIVSNSYSSSNVSGENYVGGLVGANGSPWEENPTAHPIISICYSNGHVDGDSFVGGLVGLNNAVVRDSFWDIETSGQMNSAGGTGKITADMQMRSTFTDAGWDFNTPIWKMCDGPDYPKLGWEECPEAATLLDVVSTMLDPNSLKNENMKNAFLNKLSAAQAMIDDGRYQAALNKLENDILAKTDGCADANEPDKNDWIKDCEEQRQIYPFIMETIEYVSSLAE